MTASELPGRPGYDVTDESRIEPEFAPIEAFADLLFSTGGRASLHAKSRLLRAYATELANSNDSSLMAATDEAERFIRMACNYTGWERDRDEREAGFNARKDLGVRGRL
jgi:hypothetical protein